MDRIQTDLWTALTGARWLGLRPRKSFGFDVSGVRLEAAHDSAFTVEVGPLARCDHASPEVRMLTMTPFHHRELGVAQRFSTAEAHMKSRVEGHHDVTRDVVAHWPQIHHDRLSAREHER